ncbi:membrane protease subunit (stomatin/prohibitin family) [Sphingomonas sp. UYAg733]
MGILDFLSKQFVDVIDWTEQSSDLAIRYPMQDKEIQNGAQLTVREGQKAFFYNEGKIADVFEPGLHTLDTSNLPILTALLNWDKGFASPFKSDLYFFTTKEQAGLKWGTPQPITVRDAEFGPLRIRAFGSYSFRLDNIAVFAAKLMGTLEKLTVADVEPQLRGAISTALASGLGGGSTAFVDLAADQAALSERLKAAVAPAFEAWGLTCCTFFVESLSLPDNVQEYLDKASSMRVVGDLDRYVKFQTADAIGTAAAQSGGVAGIGAGAAAGLAIGQSMAGGLGQGAGGSGGAGEDPYAMIQKLHGLLVAGAITQEEFDGKKAALLAKIG